MKAKSIAIVILLILALFTLTGCEYFDVQKQQQTLNEEAIKYLNEKYSREESFKKYERKDIDKTLGSNKFSDYICHQAMGGDGGTGCPNTPFGVSNAIQMKDNTIVIKTKNDNKYYDNKQTERIKNDFEKYYYSKLFNDYEYTDNNISFLSEYYIAQHNNNLYNNLFSRYYEEDIEQYVRNQKIYVDSVIIIWVDEEDWEEQCMNIASSIDKIEFQLLLNGKIYFMDKNMKSKVNKYLLDDNGEFYNKYQEGLLGYLKVISDDKNRDFAKYKKEDDNNIDNFTYEKIL